MSAPLTVSELASTLGMSVATVERRVKAGKFPAPAFRDERGWRYWTSEQVTELIRRKHARPYNRL